MIDAPDRVFALVTGGGTAGHVVPALVVAEELLRRGHARSSIRFVGARRGLEASAVPAAGFAIDLLPGRGLRRSLRPGALVANLGALVGLARAFVRARRTVRRFAPAVVVGVGGFASLACVVAARLSRIPAVVHEQNAAPGLVNRVAVRLGARAAVALPGTRLAGAVLTGNPVRPEIAAVVRRPDPTRPLVLVFGGSLGSRRINDAALGLYERWRDRSDVAVCHLTGERDHRRCSEWLAARRRGVDALEYRQRPYEAQMEGLYSRAGVAVCRSGALTVAELASVGLPAVLVPLPNATSDHQRHNATAMLSAGAAVMVPDAELDPSRLGDELEALLADPAGLEAMGAAGRRLAVPDAAARLADLVEEAARG